MRVKADVMYSFIFLLLMSSRPSVIVMNDTIILTIGR